MAIKLGNTQLNALNLGGVEINKAYLGAIEVFNSIQYFLRFDPINKDSIDIASFYYNWVNRSDIDLAVKFSVNGNIGSVMNVLEIGSTNNSGFGGVELYVKASGVLALFIIDKIGGVGSYSVDLFTPVLSTKYRIEIVNLEIFVDGVLNHTITTDDLINITMVAPVHLASRFTTLLNLEGDIEDFRFETKLFSCNEGSGFNLISSEGDTATGSTTNAGGLTYWNSTVWTLIP